MKISIVSCVFPPEPYNVSTNIEDLATELSGRGHDVTVICPHPNRPFGRLMDGFQRGWCSEERRGGYRVLRCWHLISRKSTFLSRFMENLSFGATSSWRLWREERPDVVYLFNWTTFAQNINSKVLRHEGVPIVSCTRDIYPETLIAQGKIKPRGWLSTSMLGMDTRHLKRCHRVITLSRDMASHLVRTRQLGQDKVEVIPVWITDAQPAADPVRRRTAREKLGVGQGSLLAVYAGGLGLAPGVDMYVDVATALKDRQDIQIRMVGKGARREPLEREIAARRLENIAVVDSASLSDDQAAADVLLLPLPEALADYCAPSKLTTYLFSGRPVVASSGINGGVGQMIREANAGYVLPAEAPGAVAEQLIEIADDPSMLDAMGQNARRYAESCLSGPTSYGRLADLLETAAG